MKKTTMQQQIQPPKKTNRNKYLSPTEQLLADKIDIKEKCRIQEKKINANFVYIRENAGGLLLSGMSSLLFPSKNTNEKNAGKIAQLDIAERFRWITAERSSCIQTSRPHSGFSDNLEKTTENLFKELVL